MRVRVSVGYMVLFSMAYLLAGCGGGSESNSDPDPVPDPKQSATVCSTPLLSQLCGTSWISDCIDQTSHFTRLTLEFGEDETFANIGRNYSDSACTSEISSLAYSGDISEGEDIALINGSTGIKIELSVDLYDGKDVSPPTMQYTIMQIDTASANILYMGDTDDTEMERDNNNRIRTSIPYRKQ
jgi:hypothetical protein